MPRPMAAHRRELAILLGLTALALVVSGIGPKHRTVWWLEVSPVLIAVPLLIATRARFPLTPLLYRLAFLHALVLVLGGHYTYAEVPPGFWVQARQFRQNRMSCSRSTMESVSAPDSFSDSSTTSSAWSVMPSSR